jgi:alginate O-acetyltransferase complex protein AlgI
LVAGPIERATHLVPQIITPRLRLTAAQKSEAFALILIGLVKKVVVADLAAQVANDVFARPGEAGFFELLIGVYCFAIQIYGDFSGYSDMARGTSKLLGIELMENFQQPYFSATITDFWRRWHRSLSQWLRDYLYIPLGGNQKGRRRTYINLSLTMLLGGLWHGAAWTFVIWGALQGLYLMVERALGWDTSPGSTGARALRTLVTFHLTCLAWIFFRADDFAQAGQFIEGLVTFRSGALPVLGFVNFLVPTALLLVVIDQMQIRLRDDPGLPRLHPRIQGLAYGLGAVTVLLASGGTPVPFVYFQF